MLVVTTVMLLLFWPINLRRTVSFYNRFFFFSYSWLGHRLCILWVPSLALWLTIFALKFSFLRDVIIIIIIILLFLGMWGRFCSRVWSIKCELFWTWTLDVRQAGVHCIAVFASQVVPDEIMENVSDQIQQVMAVPRRLDQYSQQEIEEFPKMFDWSVNI